MSFESLLGNATAIGRLRGILERKRPAHAYLFSGPEGVGKKLAAMEFVQALGAKVTVVQRPEDRHEILIAQVHEVIRSLTYTSAEPRAVIFDDAHRMSEEAMNALAINGISPPVVSRFGVHLIQVVERRSATLDPKQQREQARNVLRELKFDEAYAEWIRDLRGRAYVEMREAPQ